MESQISNFKFQTYMEVFKFQTDVEVLEFYISN